MQTEPPVPKKIPDTLVSWFTEHVWIENTLYQAALVLSAYLGGYIFYRLTRKRLSNAIDTLPLHIRVKRTLHNIKELVLPLAMLCFLLISTLAETTLSGNIDISLTRALMKVLLAWIAIRIALQFIVNPLARNFFSFTIWAIAALSILGIMDETTRALDSVGFEIGVFRLSALALIKSILALFGLLYLALFTSTFLERRVLRAKSLTRSSQVLMAKIIRITLVVFAVIIGITSAGIDLSLFAVFSGAVGLGIGFGLQKVVSNLFSGLLLLLDKSIEPGDVIELEKSGTFGWVQHMGARFIEIVTRDNKSYLIPNEEFVTQSVVNWSHGNKLIRLDIPFDVHYKSDPHQVIAIAKKAAIKPKRVMDTPEPVCWITSFGDSSLNFSLRFWIKDPEGGITNVKGEVLLMLWDAFKENGIEIPYPHLEIYAHKVP
ncbi:MAG: mechanosensitive ion channel [Alphaproteobacteria bacterium]|nr:mechanosensitive ion channel [Alphaproteobacteria bacterium]